MHIKKKLFIESVMLIALACAPVFLIALDMDVWWFLCFFIAWVASFLLRHRQYSVSVMIILLCLLILNSVDISTDTSNANFLTMGIPLLVISFGVIAVSGKFLKKSLPLKFFSDKSLSRTVVFYPIFAFVLAWIVIPRYFGVNPEVSLHRTLSVSPSTDELVRLFRGSNFLGMWDEVFFINVIFALLRRQTTFRKANIIQAFFFTSFLYELAFTGIGPILIFPFALLQGYIFEQRESIWYIVIIHLLVDTALYLSIVSSHLPGRYSWFPWF